ncbi:hypothetical protein GCM10011374_39400 [Kocuria dechangensis]|uniref:Uncharacterized protein n=1 Tax=Kocuria dechangensis TaxID=1176249 RepID=A0A917H8S9_9MICC|nr:hypothetical protein GCM10011374_39400 [Kocuria dechangensis]
MYPHDVRTAEPGVPLQAGHEKSPSSRRGGIGLLRPGALRNRREAWVVNGGVERSCRTQGDPSRSEQR